MLFHLTEIVILLCCRGSCFSCYPRLTLVFFFLIPRLHTAGNGCFGISEWTGGGGESIRRREDSAAQRSATLHLWDPTAGSLPPANQQQGEKQLRSCGSVGCAGLLEPAAVMWGLTVQKPRGKALKDPVQANYHTTTIGFKYPLYISPQLQQVVEEKGSVAAQLRSVSQTLRDTQNRCHWLEGQTQGQTQVKDPEHLHTAYTDRTVLPAGVSICYMAT